MAFGGSSSNSKNWHDRMCDNLSGCHAGWAGLTSAIEEDLSPSSFAPYVNEMVGHDADPVFMSLQLPSFTSNSMTNSMCDGRTEKAGEGHNGFDLCRKLYVKYDGVS